MDCLVVTLGILLLRCVDTTDEIKFLSEPPDIDLREGDSVILPCQVNSSIDQCFWWHDQLRVDVESTSGYRLSGNFSSGECHLHIDEVKLERDDGHWACEVHSDNETLISNGADLTVLVPPSIPVIEYNRTVYSRAGKNITVFFEENVYEVPIMVQCRTYHGRPAPRIRWFFGSNEFKARTKSILDSDRNLTLETISAVSLTVLNDQYNRPLRCIAEHPALVGRVRTTQVLVDTAYPTFNVRIYNDDEVEVVNSTAVELFCKAGGRPSPSYQWLYQAEGTNTLIPLATAQTLITKTPGFYTCEAGNIYNKVKVKSKRGVNVKVAA